MITYILKNTTGNFTNGENIVRAFPNRFWLGIAETIPEFGIEVPNELLAGVFFFDVPMGKKLKVSTLGPDVATEPAKNGQRIQIVYTSEQIAQRIAFKIWLVENVYVPEMKKLHLPVLEDVLLQLHSIESDVVVDQLIQENFYYDL